MKSKPRNLVHRAMLLSKRGGAHGKTAKQQRSTERVALKRMLAGKSGGRGDGGFVECVAQAH